MDQQYKSMSTPIITGGKLSPAGSCQGGIFVPEQGSADMWPPEQALPLGTVFPCLYSPWVKEERCNG